MKPSTVGLVVGLLMLGASSVAAAPTGAARPDSAPAAAASDAGFAAVAPLQDAALTDTRAGAGNTYAAVSSQILTAVNSGNTINAGEVASGAVNLDSNAFAGFSGLGNFVINTGNNNNLQGSLSVTINMVQASGR